MNGLAIYMEGGGDRSDGKAALRQGMNKFLDKLKSAAQANSWRWKLVPCGGRNETFRAFQHARTNPEYSTIVLLVDAEGPLQGNACAHLASRDGWATSSIASNTVHLMVESMETWFVADPKALAGFYGKEFRNSALPKTRNLETVPKARIADDLAEAIKETNKPRYHKINHASALLQLIDNASVRQRCPNCDRLFLEVGAVIK